MPTIEDGRNALEAGNLQQARLIFEAILQENTRDQDAWLGLADVLTDTNDKRICYENVLKINRNNQAAREGLRNLEPEEDPFVAALKEQTTKIPEDDESEGDDDDEMFIGAEETTISSRPAPESTGETPTAVLIAAGLGLSIIVFALLAGVIFFVLTSITGV